VFYNSTGAPVFRDDLANEHRRKVSYIRQKVRHHVFKCDIQLPDGTRESVVAYVTTAREYHSSDNGKGHTPSFSGAHETCELTLQFSPDLLLRPNINFEDVASLVLKQGIALGLQLKQLGVSLD
jgi:hypothetical protein